MAAQDYYQDSSTSNRPPPPPVSSTPQPPPGPPPGRATQPLQVPANPPYPLYDGPPPPYSPGERANSQPPPRRPTSMSEYPQDKPVQRAPPVQQQAPRPQESPRPPSYPPSGSNQSPRPRPAVQFDDEAQFRPPVRQQHSYAYPDEKRNGYTNGAGTSQYSPGYYGAQPVQPPYANGYANGGSSNNVAFAPNPQYQYPPPERSRSRSRERRKHHQRKKSNGLNTFLGAGGGALIGDAIFPGLGTLGGAILGGFGGHEYGKKSRDGKHRERRYSDEYEYRPSRR